MPASDVQRLFASLPLAVVLLAPGLSIASVNPAAEQLFGQSQRRLLGRKLGEVLTFAETRVNARLSDPEAQLSARAAVVSLAGQSARRRLDVTLAPLVDQPGWQVLTLHDIGGVHSLGEDSNSGDETMLRAPAILAHEIKNPLAGIRGAAQLLGRKLDEKDRALTGLIADEVDRIAGLIDQMQSLSRQSAEPVTPCNLHVALRRARAVIEAAGDAPVIVEEFDPSLPPVLGNLDSLVQITINLLANARDACTGVSKPQIVLRTRFASGLQFHHGESGEPVRLPIELRVSDNGPGIDPAMREHVFEPFVTSKKSGQGLGLALVRRLMRDMNGRIAHDRDEAGGWTHFRAHLPMAAAQSNQGEQAA
jgi:two-component system nitrogen regulation sensor histidine kinase GlnL